MRGSQWVSCQCPFPCAYLEQRKSDGNGQVVNAQWAGLLDIGRQNNDFRLVVALKIDLRLSKSHQRCQGAQAAGINQVAAVVQNMDVNPQVPDLQAN